MKIIISNKFNKIACIFILVMISLSLYSQIDNCDFGDRAQPHIDKGLKLEKAAEDRYSTTSVSETLLNAASEYEKALKYNPKCEELYIRLINIYIQVGEMLKENIISAYTPTECKEVLQSVKGSFSKAKYYLKKISNFRDDEEPDNLLRNIYLSESEFETDINEKIVQLKNRANSEKNVQGFFSLGANYGEVFGQSGEVSVNVSLFTQSVSGVGIVGGVGYPSDYFLNNNKSLPLLWHVGGGYLVGSYKWNILFLGMYGKIQTRENFYENTGGITLASNIKIVSDIALNLSIGYWMSDTSEIQAVFKYSVGLCYRFRF